MIFVVPALRAVATPVVGLIVATAVLLLLHVPPGVLLKKDTTEPAHARDGPIIESRTTQLLSRTVYWALQPAADVYVTTQVPTPTPVIIPEVGLMVSTVGHALDHVPPGGVAAMVIKFPVHTTVGPLIIGVGFTVTTSIDGPLPNRVNFMVSMPAAVVV